MFLDTIEDTHPKRVLDRVELAYGVFTAYFDLPKKRHLKVMVHVHEESEGQLFVGESVQESGDMRLYLSQGNDSLVAGPAASIPALLLSYLQMAAGNLEEHTYESSFIGSLLEQAFRKVEPTETKGE